MARYYSPSGNPGNGGAGGDGYVVLYFRQAHPQS